MKRKLNLYVYTALGLTLLLLFISGCKPSDKVNTDVPNNTTAEEYVSNALGDIAADESVAPAPSISQPTLPQISGEYVSAEFGAPADGTGHFVLGREAVAELCEKIKVDQETLSQYKTVVVDNYLPQIVLETSDDYTVSLGKAKGQLLLCIEDIYYDCTGYIDFDGLCSALENAQHKAVIANFPKITEISFIDPEDETRNQRVILNEKQLSQAKDMLLPSNWEIVDMYTAQDLSRGWPDFIDLYSNEVKVARLSHGDVGDSLHTVIFYYIDGNENQRAYLLAPSELYQNLRTYFESSEATPTEGSDGSVNWQFDSATGTLTFQGSGALSEHEMENADDEPYGWSALSNEVASVVIGEGITRIPNLAFYEFTSLKAVILPTTLKSIGTHAFFKCAFSELELPDELEEIGPCAFSHCMQLVSCEIPGSVRVLEGGTFEQCVSLQELKLNEGTEVLKDACLYCCDNIDSLIIPPSIICMEELYAQIEVMVFLGDCPALAYHEESGKAYFMYSGTVYYPTGNDTWHNFISYCKDESITWIEGLP